MEGQSSARLEYAVILAVKTVNPLVWKFKKFEGYYEQFLLVRAYFYTVVDKFAECLHDFSAQSMFYLLSLVANPVQRVYCLVLLAQAHRTRKSDFALFLSAARFFSYIYDAVQQFLLRTYVSELINGDESLFDLTSNNFWLLLENYTQITLPDVENYAFLILESSWGAETLLVRSSASLITKKYESRALITQWLCMCVLCSGREFLAQWHVVKELLIEQLAAAPAKNRLVFVQLFVKLLVQHVKSTGKNTDLTEMITQFNEYLLCKTTCYTIFDFYSLIVKSAPKELRDVIIRYVIDPLFGQIILYLKAGEIGDSFYFIQFLLLILDYTDSDFMQKFVQASMDYLFVLLSTCDYRNAEIFFTKFAGLLLNKNLHLSVSFAALYLKWTRELASPADFMYDETMSNVCRLLSGIEVDSSLTDAVTALNHGGIAYTFLLGLSEELRSSEFAKCRALLSEQQRMNMLLFIGQYDEELYQLLINYKLDALKYFLGAGKYEVAKRLYSDLEAEVATTRDRAELEIIRMYYGKSDVYQLIKLAAGAVCEFEVLCEVGYWQKSTNQPIDPAVIEKLPLLQQNCGDSKTAYVNLASYVLSY